MANHTETKQMKNALRHEGATAPPRPKKIGSINREGYIRYMERDCPKGHKTVWSVDDDGFLRYKYEPNWREEEEEEDTSTFVVRVEKAVYDKDGELDWIRTTNEYEFDTYEEALEEYNAYIIEPIGEMLYLDEKDEDGDQENIESRGKYKHEEEE
tara:strand:- start:48 stop:512 length:465 start_codon:yes stop_codon:yes gene_type:complete